MSGKRREEKRRMSEEGEGHGERQKEEEEGREKK